MKAVIRMDKTWKVTATIGKYTEVYYSKAETLYDSFFNFYKLYGSKHLVEIHITEVKQDE